MSYIAGLFTKSGYCGTSGCTDSHAVCEKIELWDNHPQFAACCEGRKYVYEPWMVEKR
jgi:hypothetical protein